MMMMHVSCLSRLIFSDFGGFISPRGEFPLEFGLLVPRRRPSIAQADRRIWSFI